MDVRRLIILTIGLLGLVFLFLCGYSVFGAIAIFVNHRSSDPYVSQEVELRTPSLTIIRGGSEEGKTQIVSRLLEGNAKPSNIPGRWPCFRGEFLDGISHETTRLIDKFPSEGPPILWDLEFGEGYAGVAIRDGRVYLLDYDMKERRDTLRCLSLDNGKEIWNYSYPVKVKRNHGMSRTVPAVTERYCVTIGPKCHLACVDAVTGKEIWFLDMVEKYGTEVPDWYAGQCPLLVDENGRDVLILAPAGPEVMMCAIDLESGNEIWRCPNPFAWKMTHVSVAVLEMEGRKTYVYSGSDGVLGCDGSSGELLWSSDDWKVPTATCPSPLVLPDNRIFFCGGYNSSSAMMQIVPKSDGTYEARTLFKLRAQIFGSTQQTPIFYEGFIYGIRERDKQFVCLDLDGKVVWQSGSTAKFGLGPYMVADGKFLILDDSTKLTIAEASSESYKELDSHLFFDGHDAWAPMAIVDGRLILRDLTRMICIDLRAGRVSDR